MRRIVNFINAFFFSPISARAFGIVRVNWAALVFLFMLLQWKDVIFLYSDAGMFTNAMGDDVVFRGSYRFSLFDYLTTPKEVFALYLVLLTTTFFMLLGIWTRFFTIASVLILFSFHERNLLMLGGYDTVLRTIGYILIFTPNISCFSITRARKQWDHWKESFTLLPTPQMSIWPYRLILWQVIILYFTAGWDKTLGSMWWEGTASASAFHHTHFTRFSIHIMDILGMGSWIFSYGTVLWQLAFILLLIPATLWNRMTRGHYPYLHLKRTLFIIGFIFHVLIWVLLVVGPFSPIMITLYIGTFIQADFDAMRSWFNTKWQGSIAVNFDKASSKQCRYVFLLNLLDWLGRLEYIGVQSEPTVRITLPDGKTASGFGAFKILCRNLPFLWILFPIHLIPVRSKD